MACPRHCSGFDRGLRGCEILDAHAAAVVRLPVMRVALLVGQRAIELDASVARSPSERERGFTGRTSLLPNEAILFAFPSDTTQPFTMTQTHASLDMLFFDAAGRLVWKFERTFPGRLDPYAPPVSYRYALEVPGGWSAAHGVADQAVIAWPVGGFTAPV